MVVCPRCDGQGEIYIGEVMGLRLFICDECDACWRLDEETRKDNFKDLTTYLKSIGISPKHLSVKQIKYI